MRRSVVNILTQGCSVKLLRPNLKLGIYVALATVLGPIFIPPLIAPYLEEWQVAQEQLSQMQVQQKCANQGQVELSPWFYSFNVSGGSGKAKFNGVVTGIECEKKFTVHFTMTNYAWKISNLIWD